MNIRILSRETLKRINAKTFQYPLAIAEKDFFLALVSKAVYDSSLRDRIVFKGGTALHHVYLDQLRFSEDLDFGSLDKKILLEEVKQVLESFDFLNVKKEFVSKATIKIEKLQYAGPLGLPNSLKFEIDVLQDVVLSPIDLPYKNAWGVETLVRVMDIREICAEKIRAASDRARYRDFYDVFLIFKEHSLNMEEVVSLVGRKEIRKPICKKSILDNWRLVKNAPARESRIVFYARPVKDIDIENLIARLPFESIEKNPQPGKD